MFYDKTLTIYNFFIRQDKKIECYRTVLFNNFIDERRRTAYVRSGQKKAHSAYISIRDIGNYMREVDWVQLGDKRTNYTLQNNSLDFIVVGDCGVEINTTDLDSVQESINNIMSQFKSYKSTEYDERMNGSLRSRHIEVGGV